MVCYYERCVARGPTLALALESGCHRGHDSACGRTAWACNTMRMRLVLTCMWSPYRGNAERSPRCSTSSKCKSSLFPRAGQHFESTCGVSQLVWWFGGQVCWRTGVCVQIQQMPFTLRQQQLGSGKLNTPGSWGRMDCRRLERAAGAPRRARRASLCAATLGLRSSLKGRADSHQLQMQPPNWLCAHVFQPG